MILSDKELSTSTKNWLKKFLVEKEDNYFEIMIELPFYFTLMQFIVASVYAICILICVN